MSDREPATKSLPVGYHKRPGMTALGVALIGLPRKGPISYKPGHIEELLASLESVSDEILTNVAHMIKDMSRSGAMKYMPSAATLRYMCDVAHRTSQCLAILTWKHGKQREMEERKQQGLRKERQIALDQQRRHLADEERRAKLKSAFAAKRR